ncbi:MAG: phosphorelay protein [Rhodospirillales bacterium]
MAEDEEQENRENQEGQEEAQESTIIRTPDTLKSKVGTGGPGAVDLETLARAEAVIASLSDDYLKWVEEDFKKLDDALAKLIAEKDNRKEHLDRIFQISHDVKGQGGSFGYDMMTIIGNQLCRFVEDMEDADDAEIEAVTLHIDALKMVIAKRMEGDGGAEGESLFSGLEKVVAKLK